MHAERHTVSLTTAADGSATVYTDKPVTGRVLGIRYVKPASGGFDNGSTMTVTVEDTGEAIWAETGVNASASRYPRPPVQDEVGVDALIDATRKQRGAIHVAGSRLKLVVSGGGNAKAATLHYIIG